MKPEIVRSETEINRVLDWAQEGEDQGTRYAGMSYEQGIKAMYAWLVGDEDAAPDAEE